MIKLKTLLGEAGKFGRYSRYNDEPFNFRDDKTSLPKKTRPEWDAFVDKYNSIDGYETKTSSDGLSYDAEIKNIETGLRWVVQGRKGNNWNYIGRTVGYTGNPEFLRDEKQLIANFEEINGINESGLNEQIAKPIDLEKILVKNFLKFKLPAKQREIETVYMPQFDNPDNMFQDIDLNVEATKTEYMAWLQKNGFQPGDIYVDDANAGRVQKQILAKKFK
jgi:hypothetical protein